MITPVEELAAKLDRLAEEIAALRAQIAGGQVIHHHHYPPVPAAQPQPMWSGTILDCSEPTSQTPSVHVTNGGLRAVPDSGCTCNGAPGSVCSGCSS